MINNKFSNKFLLKIFYNIVNDEKYDIENYDTSIVLDRICIQNFLKMMHAGISEKDKKHLYFVNKFCEEPHLSKSVQYKNGCFYQESDEILENFENNAKKILNNQFIHASFNSDLLTQNFSHNKNKTDYVKLISNSVFNGKWQINFDMLHNKPF